MSASLSCGVDHLVLACADLAQGAGFVRERLGVEVQPGGRHLLMGTHNALLRLAPRTYLELIALDPEGRATRPRWFGLDTPAVRARMAAGPFLLTWVAACSDIDAAAALDPRFGETIAASRGAFLWRITVPADGSLNCGGAMPTLIQWHGQAHPCDGLEDRGCALRGLDLRHPQAQGIEPLLAALRLQGSVTLRPGEPAIVARLATLRGEVELR
jgi:hypothetical protein